MGVIAIELDYPPSWIALLRKHAAAWEAEFSDSSCRLATVADAIEAAADKRIIVLDVDELGLDEGHASAFHYSADNSTLPENRVLRAVADALDSLTPPRPTEPAGLGAVVRTGRGETLIRLHLGDIAPWRIAGSDSEVDRPWRYYKDQPDPIEVLSPGVHGGES